MNLNFKGLEPRETPREIDEGVKKYMKTRTPPEKTALSAPKDSTVETFGKLTHYCEIPDWRNLNREDNEQR